MNILDPKFRYTPAAKTDIRKTFARIRKQQAAASAIKGKYKDRISSVEEFLRNRKECA